MSSHSTHLDTPRGGMQLPLPNESWIGMTERQLVTSIRRATTDDADALFGLAEEFATSFVTERAAFEIALASIISTNDANLSVAEVNGVVVGYCLGFDHYTFYANGRVAWV